jgi:hypothetical protein
MRVNNPYCSTVGIDRGDAAPAPPGFAEIVCYNLPVISFDWFDFHDHLGVLDAFRLPVADSGDVGNFFLNQFLLQKDLRGRFQLPRLHNIAQFPGLLVRQQQRAFLNLNHTQ